MSELKEIKTDTQATAGNASASAPMHWPGILVGVGMVCLFGALFVGAAMKESGGLAPKILGAVGLVVMVLGIVGTIVHAISSRAKR